MEKFFFKSFIDLIYNTIASRSGLILLAVFFSTYIRFDAEYLILMSVFFFDAMGIFNSFFVKFNVSKI